MEKEIREQIRQQINYASSFIQDLEVKYWHKLQNQNPETWWQIKYATEKVLKKVVQWITIGDMEKEEYYIESCQMEVLNTIRNIVNIDEVHTEEFRNSIEQRVKELIYALVDMNK